MKTGRYARPAGKRVSLPHWLWKWLFPVSVEDEGPKLRGADSSSAPRELNLQDRSVCARNAWPWCTERTETAKIQNKWRNKQVTLMFHTVQWKWVWALIKWCVLVCFCFDLLINSLFCSVNVHKLIQLCFFFSHFFIHSRFILQMRPSFRANHSTVWGRSVNKYAN